MPKDEPTNYFQKSLEAEVIVRQMVGMTGSVPANFKLLTSAPEDTQPPEQIPVMRIVSASHTIDSSLITLGSLADSFRVHGQPTITMMFINEPLRPRKLTGWRGLHFWNELNQVKSVSKKPGA